MCVYVVFCVSMTAYLLFTTRYLHLNTHTHTHTHSRLHSLPPKHSLPHIQPRHQLCFPTGTTRITECQQLRKLSRGPVSAATTSQSATPPTETTTTTAAAAPCSHEQAQTCSRQWCLPSPYSACHRGSYWSACDAQHSTAARTRAERR